MGVNIGHASISETGSINGAKGDSTGKEVCIRSWYKKPWDFMAIHPDAAVREKHAAAVEDCCSNNNIGYGQADRNTAYARAKEVGFEVGKIKTKCNCDCSSLQNLCAVISGANVTYGSNGWVTSNMKAKLAAAGYKIITDSTYVNNEEYCVRGAIYVKASSHTVCGLTNGSKASKTLAKAGITSGSAPSGNTSGNTSGGINRTPKWTGVVTATELNVRTWAGTEYGNIRSYPVLAKGNKVDVCDSVKAADGDVWYFARIAGKYYGFVHSDYIKKDEEQKKLAVGDVVNFTGNKHYTSSYAAGTAKSCKAGQAEITAINEKGAHPYHLKKTSGSKSTVYGWVNEDDIEA